VCRCGAQADARGIHSFVCEHALGRALRHHALNDVVATAFTSAGIPVTKERTGLSRTDGKRPHGMTLIPWQAGRPVIWDVTVACTSADSYEVSVREVLAITDNITDRLYRLQWGKQQIGNVYTRLPQSHKQISAD